MENNNETMVILELVQKSKSRKKYAIMKKTVYEVNVVLNS